MADVCIIGAGIAGLLSARELSIAGASVLLLDKGQPARESTWAGGGILSPLYPWRYPDAVSRLAQWGQSEYPELATALRDFTGIDPELEPSGLLIDAPDELDSARSWADRYGQDLRLVTGGEIRELEPSLATPPDRAIWLPAVRQVRNPRLARALLTDLERRGVTVTPNVAAENFVTEGNRITHLQTAQGPVSAARYVVCGGAWSAPLLSPTGLQLPVRPVKGQMLLFRCTPGTISRIYLSSDRYTVPRRDGRVLFGSTLEEAGYDKEPTEAARAELTAIAIDRYPALAQCRVEKHWAGLRPGSPDGVPFIGRHPNLDNLWVNTGQYRNGIVLGPASARLLADLVSGREPSFNPGAYALRSSPVVR